MGSGASAGEGREAGRNKEQAPEHEKHAHVACFSCSGAVLTCVYVRRSQYNTINELKKQCTLYAPLLPFLSPHFRVFDPFWSRCRRARHSGRVFLCLDASWWWQKGSEVLGGDETVEMVVVVMVMESDG